MDDFVIICNIRLDLQYVVAVLICIQKRILSYFPVMVRGLRTNENKAK